MRGPPRHTMRLPCPRTHSLNTAARSPPCSRRMYSTDACGRAAAEAAIGHGDVLLTSAPGASASTAASRRPGPCPHSSFQAPRCPRLPETWLAEASSNGAGGGEACCIGHDGAAVRRCTASASVQERWRQFEAARAFWIEVVNVRNSAHVEHGREREPSLVPRSGQAAVACIGALHRTLKPRAAGPVAPPVAAACAAAVLAAILCPGVAAVWVKVQDSEVLRAVPHGGQRAGRKGVSAAPVQALQAAQQEQQGMPGHGAWCAAAGACCMPEQPHVPCGNGPSAAASYWRAPPGPSAGRATAAPRRPRPARRLPAGSGSAEQERRQGGP